MRVGIPVADLSAGLFAGLSDTAEDWGATLGLAVDLP